MEGKLPPEPIADGFDVATVPLLAEFRTGAGSASTSFAACLFSAAEVARLDADDSRKAEDGDTAHQISQDPWYQVGFVLTTGLNSSYVLGYSGSIMVPLGWTAGACGMILSALLSMYANSLLAHLHTVGGTRHIRYRDLACHVYGRKAYALTWALQYINLFMINTGYIILAGQALKAVFQLYWGDVAFKLSYCIIIAGFVCALFAFGVPHLSALGTWLGFSMVLSLIYIVTAVVLSLKDGMRMPQHDYSISGTSTSGIFSTVGAIANLFFVYNTGMLPEIQSTIRPPVIKNMDKALWFQFSIGLIPLYAVTFVGYWAYGSTSSSYLLNSINGPSWLMMITNLASFLQTVISLHIFASPMYEYFDMQLVRVRDYIFNINKIMFRILIRGGYLTISTIVAVTFPFLGVFMSLTGALSTFPLTFILANHMYLTVNKNKLSALGKSWHWLNVIAFGGLSVAAAVAAVKLIAIDATANDLFVNI